MKKLLFFIFLFIPVSSWATTWYVRDGGGSVYGTANAANTCNGQTNVIYSLGVSPNCAVNDPALIIGVTGQNGNSTQRLLGGDTLNIDGDSDNTPGTQAQYLVGYGMANSSSGANECSASFKFNCYWTVLPAGSDASHRTSIIGTGTHKPYLYGVFQLYQMIDSEVNHVLIQWLEITDNIECAYNDPTEGCTGNGFQGIGMILAGDDVNVTDVYIHGMGSYGVYGKAFVNATFTRLWVIGNGYGGFLAGQDGNESLTGTLTFNQPIIDWNGCVEKYPLGVNAVEDPTNYKNCFGQASGGYGDGLGFGATSGLPAGNWTITGPGSISFNTQDGLDILHGIAGTGTDQIDKMRIEGNAGQQLKITGLNDKVTNSLIIGDCGWWQGSAQALSGGMLYGDSCRAQGSTIRFSVGDNVNASFINNTIITYAIALESDQASSCTGTVLTVKNNIIQGGWAWLDNATVNPGNAGGNAATTNLYNDGSDGNGAGPCGSLTETEDYNLIYGNKNSNSPCSGGHDKCGTSPGFSTNGGVFPAGTQGGVESTYYNAWSGISNVVLSSGSAAKGAGVNGLTYWNDSNDYNAVVRSNPPSMGGEEQPSCVVTNGFCFLNADCCGGTCTANACNTGGGGGGSSSSSLRSFIIGKSFIYGKS